MKKYKIKLKLKLIPIKWIYFTSAMIVILITVVLYRTYAMYNVNTNAGNSFNSEILKTYAFDINDNQNFTIAANSIYSFNVLITNTTDGDGVFEIYYASSNNLSNVVVAEVVEDVSLIPRALNTSFTLAKNGSKVVPLVIQNNGSSAVDISINIAKSFVGNTVSYNGTKVTQTYNISDITNICGTFYDVNDCILDIKEGQGVALYCLVY